MYKYTFIFCIVISTLGFSQFRYASETPMETDFFTKFGTPTGILFFPGSNNPKCLEEEDKFYSLLTTALIKQKKYMLNQYKNLNDLRTSWGFYAWDKSNPALLRKLNSELDIKLIFLLIYKDTSLSEFSIKIISTSTGMEIFSKEYLRSINSEPIDDAIKLFTKTCMVTYDLAKEFGTVDVSATRRGKFQVYLNNQYMGDTPLSIDNLSRGKYTLSVHDNSERFKPLTEEFSFEPFKESNLTLQKEISLEPETGSLKLQVYPDSASISLYDNEAVFYKMSKGNLSLTVIPAGNYTIRCTLEGYDTLSAPISIFKGKMTERVIELNRLPEQKFIIKTVDYNDKIVTIKYFLRTSNKYYILYDLYGRENDIFEISLYLRAKDDEAINYKLKMPYGDCGSKIKPGENLRIDWDFSFEFPNGFEGKDLYLALIVNLNFPQARN